MDGLKKSDSIDGAAAFFAIAIASRRAARMRARRQVPRRMRQQPPKLRLPRPHSIPAALAQGQVN
jgi:hypothetical protein